jgi:hypothetical protein
LVLADKRGSGNADGGDYTQEQTLAFQCMLPIRSYRYYNVKVKTINLRQPSDSPNKKKPNIESSQRHDTSPNLRDIVPVPPRGGPAREVPLRRLPPPKPDDVKKDGG